MSRCDRGEIASSVRENVPAHTRRVSRRRKGSARQLEDVNGSPAHASSSDTITGPDCSRGQASSQRPATRDSDRPSRSTTFTTPTHQTSYATLARIDHLERRTKLHENTICAIAKRYRSQVEPFWCTLILPVQHLRVSQSASARGHMRLADIPSLSQT